MAYTATKAIRTALRNRNVWAIWTNKKADVTKRNVKCWAPKDEKQRNTLINDVLRDMAAQGIEVLDVRTSVKGGWNHTCPSVIFDVAI